jgi:membrane protease subunit HflK
VVARAEGETKRFTKLLLEYNKSPGVTRDRLYLDMMESVLNKSSKVMVDVKGSNNLLYLPLDKLMSRDGSSGSASTESERGDILKDLTRQQSNNNTRSREVR